MISTDLQNLADRLAAYAMHGRAIEPEHAACIASALLDHARVVAMLETLPFEVTLATLDLIQPEPAP